MYAYTAKDYATVQGRSTLPGPSQSTIPTCLRGNLKSTISRTVDFRQGSSVSNNVEPMLYHQSLTTLR